MMENVDGKASRLKCIKSFRTSVPFWIIICEITIILTLGQPSAVLTSDDVDGKPHPASARAETPEVFSSDENKIELPQVDDSIKTSRQDFDRKIRSYVESELENSRSCNLSERVLYLIKLNSNNEKSGKSNHAQNSTEFRKLSLRAAQSPTRKMSNSNLERRSFIETPTRIVAGNNFPNESNPNTLSKVSLLGLFELTTLAGGERWEGRSELAAAKLAVKHVNERRLLPGYVLELITNDTQVSLWQHEQRMPLYM